MADGLINFLDFIYNLQFRLDQLDSLYLVNDGINW